MSARDQRGRHFRQDLGIVWKPAGMHAWHCPWQHGIQLFLSVSGRGLGAMDDSQVIAAYRALRGKV